MREILQETIKTILLSLSLFFVMHLMIQNFRVEGSSMTPTLVEGQHIVVNKIVYSRIDREDFARFLPFVPLDCDESSGVVYAFGPPERGDIVIFHSPRQESLDLVKRVIGVPGDTIEIKSGRVFRNGEAIEEPYITNRDNRTIEPTEVPPGSYYVLGDNRVASSDSRSWGFLEDEYIIGKAWGSYWPIDRARLLDGFPIAD